MAESAGHPPGAWKSLLIGLPVAALGVSGLVLIVYSSWYGLASRGWPTTEGVIVKSRVNRSLQQAGKAPRYGPAVEYRYTVDGQEHRGDRITFAGTESAKDERECRRQLDARYPVNKRCPVSYDPTDPATSCLEPGASLLLPLIFGPLSLLFAAGGLSTIGYGVWRLAKRERG